MRSLLRFRPCVVVLSALLALVAAGADAATCGHDPDALPNRAFLRTSGIATDQTNFIAVLPSSNSHLTVALTSVAKGAPFLVVLQKAGVSSASGYCTSTGLVGDDETVYVDISHPLTGTIPLQVLVLLGSVPGASVSVRIFETAERVVTLPSPSAGSARFTIASKSYIARMATERAIADGKPDDETNANLGFGDLVGGRVAAYELLLATDQLFSENPLTPDQASAQFRLWSTVDIEAQCEAGEIKSYSVGELKVAFGTEGPLQAVGDVLSPISTSEERVEGHLKSVTLGYAIEGRPHALALPAFEQVRPRSCSWIWHKVTATLACSGNKVRITSFEDGSQFPSRKLWVGNTVTDFTPQGPFDRLWSCSEDNPKLVR